jgi:hypothetical protein
MLTALRSIGTVVRVTGRKRARVGLVASSWREAALVTSRTLPLAHLTITALALSVTNAPRCTTSIVTSFCIMMMLLSIDELTAEEVP